MKLVARKRQTLHPITKKHPSRLPAYGATSPDVFLSCGKQDLNSTGLYILDQFYHMM